LYACPVECWKRGPKPRQVTGILDTAERQLGVGTGNVVDEHHSSVDAAGNFSPARNILGEDRAAQSEVGVVGERDRLTARSA
jgi:hypothetical protein